MGRGSKPKRTFIIEVVLKSATFLTAMVEFISILFISKFQILIKNNFVRYIGFILSLFGIIIFITTMVTMCDSWRDGMSSIFENVPKIIDYKHQFLLVLNLNWDKECIIKQSAAFYEDVLNNVQKKPFSMDDS